MPETQTKPIANGQVPKVALKLLTGEQITGGRSAGVFTTDDLISILLYVRTGRQLPATRQALIADLGTDKTGIPGLEPDQIVSLYQQVTDHANRWTPVETKVREQTSGLKIASEQITTTGGNIIKVINAMDITEQAITTIGESRAQIKLTTDKDKKIHEALPKVIARLRETCEEQQKKTETVLNAVRDYRTELSGGTLKSGKQVSGLEPAVADKKERAKKADLGGTIDKLQKEIDSLEEQIKQKEADYKKYVGLAFTGAAGGLIGLAITGGIFGAKAEATRKEKNELIDQKNKKSIALKKDQAIQGALNVFSTQFTDLGMRLLDAEEALSHLQFLWRDILARIDSSVEMWKKVDNGEFLMTFLTDMQNIVKPWSEVGDLTAKLSKVFDQAYAEFKKTYGA
jgi:hypothetical protein